MNDDLIAAFQKLNEQISRIQRNISGTKELLLICLGALGMIALMVEMLLW